jgi:ferric-dicitrate binding protein FerR (iron transport regulator)
MSEHRDVDLVARLLKERLQGISYPPPSFESRATAIAALERRMIFARRARRARVTSVVAAAAAVVLLAGYAGLHSRIKGTQPLALAMTGEGFGPGVSVVGRTGTRALQARGSLSAGERIVTSETGWGAIDLSTGTHLLLERQSELAIRRADVEQRFVLGRGSVRADVAHLRPGERFIIATVDAEVEVRGTSFRVSIVPSPCAGASQTQVAVYEGLVRVRHGSREFAVARGETWALGCPEEPVRGEARTEAPGVTRHAEPIAKPVIVKPVIVKSAALDTRESPRSVSPTPSAPLRTEETARVPSRALAPQESLPSESAPRLEPAPRPVGAISVLALQNQMFSEAEAAQRAGDHRRALSAFERLEERYPDGPLAESSMVERLRILRVENPRAAVALARTYLSRFPSGFARVEAQAIRDR